MAKNPCTCLRAIFGRKKNRRFVFGKFVKTCRELDLSRRRQHPLATEEGYHLSSEIQEYQGLLRAWKNL